MPDYADQAKEFAEDHPYVAFGALLVPVTWGTTGDALTSLFVGGAVAFGPAIASGLNDATEDDDSNGDAAGGMFDDEYFEGDGDE